MKPRRIQTIKLLAVAVAAAGCAKPTKSEPAPVPPAQPAQAEAPGSARAAEAPRATAAPVPPPVPESGSALDLSRELRNATRAEALQNMPHFRPLCDADGYPLVGNLGEKGNGYFASELCEEVRKQARR